MCENSHRHHQPHAPHQQHADRHPTLAQVTALQPDFAEALEYGVLERAFAVANPEQWHFLMDRYGHTAVAAKQYTVSAFLGGVLGRLWRSGVVAGFTGEATGRWAYNRTTGYWALFPEPDRSSRLSWADSGFTVEYVPGQTEE